MKTAMAILYLATVAATLYNACRTWKYADNLEKALVSFSLLILTALPALAMFI